MSRRLVVSALGVAQILAWGSSYYLTAVLAKPIATDTGWSLTWVVGGLSAGLLASGIRRRSGLISVIVISFSESWANTQSFKTEAHHASPRSKCRASGFVQSQNDSEQADRR